MPWLAAGVGVGIGGLISGVGGYLSAKEQSKAAKQASADQLAAMQQASYQQQQAAERANRMLLEGTGGLPSQLNQIQQALGASASDISQGNIQAQQYLLEALGGSRRDIQTGMSQLGQGYGRALQSLIGARGDLSSGQAGLEQALGQYGGQAASSFTGGATGAEQALSRIQALQGFTGGATNAVGVLGGPGRALMSAAAQDPFSGFQADPGYQFRQEQGEQAINRAAAARGGRLSGRTLKELGRFNQGLASQEYQNFANRGLAARGQNLQAAGAIQQSLENLSGRQLQAGLAAQQNQAQLAGLGYGAQQQIAGIRSGLGQNLANLQMGMGQQIGASRAGLGTQLAGLGQQAAGYQVGMGQQQAALQNQLASLGMQTGQTQAQMQQNYGQNLSNLYMNAGQNMAQLMAGNVGARAGNLMSGAGSAGQMAMASLPAYQAAVPYAGQGTAAIANAANSTLSNLMFLGASQMGGGGGFGPGWAAIGNAYYR